MATTKVSELTELTSAASDDLFLVADVSTNQSKKITKANLGISDENFTTALKTKLDGIATNAIANVVEDTTPQLGGNLDTNGNNINFGDNDKAQFGASGDLQIYHTGSYSTIHDSGTGNLSIKATDLVLGDSGGNAFVVCTDNGTGGEVALYHNAVEKLTTTSSGIDVTGTITSDGLTVDGTSGTDHIEITNGTAGSDASPQFMDLTFTGFSNRDMARVRGVNRNSSRQGGSLQFETSDANSTDGSTYKKRLFIDTDGDISFYEDTGTTAKLFWDASAESLGIGTSSPSDKLDISTGNINLSEGYTLAWGGGSGRPYIQGNKASQYVAIGNNGSERMRIIGGNVGIGTTTPLGKLDIILSGTDRRLLTTFDDSIITLKGSNASSNPEHLRFVGDSLRFSTGTSGSGNEAMRIDNSGNLLVGTTNTTPASSNVSGVKLTGINHFSHLNNTVIRANRISTDGTIIEFRKDGTSVGGIGTASSKLTLTDTRLVDNDKLSFGNSDDLQIYHDGGHSRVTDNGSGNLYIETNGAGVYINKGTSENMAQFIVDGAVNLYHNNSKKFETTSTGVDVTGGVLSTTGWFGLDATDNIQFSNNAYMDVRINNASRIRVESDGDLHADGDVIAYSTTISDERLKENIQPIEHALQKVKLLKGCTFTYTVDGKDSAGLIAQDVEKVLPSAVSEKELPLKKDDGIAYKTLQYDQTIGLLVEAIKELTAKVEELENK